MKALRQNPWVDFQGFPPQRRISGRRNGKKTGRREGAGDEPGVGTPFPLLPTVTVEIATVKGASTHKIPVSMSTWTLRDFAAPLTAAISPVNTLRHQREGGTLVWAQQG